MRRYEVTFYNGDVEVVEAESLSEAKEKAKEENPDIGIERAEVISDDDVDVDEDENPDDDDLEEDENPDDDE